MTMPMLVSDIQGSQRFALAQAVGRTGIPVIGTVPCDAPWAEHSRYIQRLVHTPDPAEVLTGIYASALKKAGIAPAVWLPSYDGSADFTVRYTPFLQQVGLRFLMPGADGLERRNLQNLQAFEGDIRIPFCRVFQWSGLAQQADRLPYPVLLKTVRSQHVMCRDVGELRAHLQAVAGEYEADDIVQAIAYVPGEVPRMASAMLLFDQDSRPVRGFTGRRLRVEPTRFGPFGETTAARAEWLPELYEGACELLSDLKWQGFAEVECKQDEDGRWSLLEVNPRPSGWMCLAEADGAGMLTAYHRICADGAQLSEAVLQRSRTRYVRMVGNSYHVPDWACDSRQGDWPWHKLRRFWEGVRDYRRDFPNLLLGAWDARDGRANRSMAWLTLKWVFARGWWSAVRRLSFWRR